MNSNISTAICKVLAGFRALELRSSKSWILPREAIFLFIGLLHYTENHRETRVLNSFEHLEQWIPFLNDYYFDSGKDRFS